MIRSPNMPDAPAQPAESITLRWGSEEAVCHPIPPERLEEMSLRWSNVVWKRRCWRDRPELISELFGKAVDTLQSFGIRQEEVEAMAKASVVEIGLPYPQPSLCYMPW